MFVFETDPTLDPSPSIKSESFPEFNFSMHHPLLVELAGDLYALGDDSIMFTHESWRTNVGYQVYELVAYRMLNDDYSIERIRAFDPSIITSWGWDIGYDAPLKYSFAHVGGRRVCFAKARFVSHETQKHGIGMMHLFVSTFEFSFEDGNDGSRSFSVKSLLDYSADSSRIFQILLDDPQESGDATLLNAQLLGCFVL